MTSYTQRAISLVGVIAIFTVSAAAQQAPVAIVPLTSSPPTWASAKGLMEHRKVDIVTVVQPDARKHCDVAQMDADKITCSHAFRDNQTYARADIEAIIVRAKSAGHPHLAALGGWTAGGVIFGSIGYGIFLLALLGPAGAVAAGALSLIAAFNFLFIMMLALYEPSDPPSAALPEAIVYVQPGTTYKGVQGDTKIQPSAAPSSESLQDSAAESVPSAS